MVFLGNASGVPREAFGHLRLFLGWQLNFGSCAEYSCRLCHFACLLCADPASGIEASPILVDPF